VPIGTSPITAVVGGDPVVGAQGQLAAAAERVTGDRGDDRLGDASDGRERFLKRARAPDHPRVVEELHLLDVRAGREHLLAAVQDHRPDVVALRHLCRQLAEPVLGGDVEGVHRGAVEADRADAFGDFQVHGHGFPQLSKSTVSVSETGKVWQVST
jgi:hypothetical protein